MLLKKSQNHLEQSYNSTIHYQLKGRLAVWVVPTTEKYKARRKIYQQKRRDQAKVVECERIEKSVRESFEALSQAASAPVKAVQIIWELDHIGYVRICKDMWISHG